MTASDTTTVAACHCLDCALSERGIVGVYKIEAGLFTRAGLLNGCNVSALAVRVR